MEGPRKYGWLGPIEPGGSPGFIDAWGNPVIFHVPKVYPEGLPYRTTRGDVNIRPLSESVWPPEKGPVQIWSLGENGLDDRGKGDDIVASMGGDFRPPLSR